MRHNKCALTTHALRVPSTVHADEFLEMWATPPNVDLRGLCSSHHIPFQQVKDLPSLQPALQAAWGLATSSVVEVITDRSSNVEVHRTIQHACTQAAHRVMYAKPELLDPPPDAVNCRLSQNELQCSIEPNPHFESLNALAIEKYSELDLSSPTTLRHAEPLSQRCSEAPSNSWANTSSIPQHDRILMAGSFSSVSNGADKVATSDSAVKTSGAPGHIHDHPAVQVHAARGDTVKQRRVWPLPALQEDGLTVRRSMQPVNNATELCWVVQSVKMHAYNLPLAAPVTSDAASKNRKVGIVCIELAQVASSGHATASRMGGTFGVVEGLGEVAPLSGLHRESWQAAASQVAALSELLRGCEVPAELALLQGQASQWWQRCVGVSEVSLMPSVHFAVECALVDALAEQQARSFASHLAHCAFVGEVRSKAKLPHQLAGPCKLPWLQQPCMDSEAFTPGSVLVNALLDTEGARAKAAPSCARLMVQKGYSTLKVKVCHWTCLTMRSSQRHGLALN
jgi:hypothetical protein